MKITLIDVIGEQMVIPDTTPKEKRTSIVSHFFSDRKGLMLCNAINNRGHISHLTTNSIEDVFNYIESFSSYQSFLNYDILITNVNIY